MGTYAAGDRRLRLEGGGNLLRAAIACGVQRYLQQSSGFFLKPIGPGLADESAALDVNASPGVAASAQTYAELERRLLGSAEIGGSALRYGFFYGPGTWYYPGGSAADTVMRQQNPVIGSGQGVSSFVHIEDAAIGTVAALTAKPGVYNLVDDDPSPQAIWLPAFAAFLGAPSPPHLSESEANGQLGEDAVYYATRLSGASNAQDEADTRMEAKAFGVAGFSRQYRVKDEQIFGAKLCAPHRALRTVRLVLLPSGEGNGDGFRRRLSACAKRSRRFTTPASRVGLCRAGRSWRAPA